MWQCLLWFYLGGAIASFFIHYSAMNEESEDNDTSIDIASMLLVVFWFVLLPYTAIISRKK